MENEDYKLRFECAADLMHAIIRESNEKNDIISHLKTEIRQLKEQLYEIRYNPYHDPENGRFTSANGVDISGKSGIIKATPEQRQRITNELCGTKTTNGVVITAVSQHAADRMLQRGLSIKQAKDVLTKAVISYTGNVPNTHCVQKENWRLVYSDSGNLITVVDLEN